MIRRSRRSEKHRWYHQLYRFAGNNTHGCGARLPGPDNARVARQRLADEGPMASHCIADARQALRPTAPLELKRELVLAFDDIARWSNGTAASTSGLFGHCVAQMPAEELLVGLITDPVLEDCDLAVLCDVLVARLDFLWRQEQCAAEFRVAELQKRRESTAQHLTQLATHPAAGLATIVVLASLNYGPPGALAIRQPIVDLFRQIADTIDPECAAVCFSLTGSVRPELLRSTAELLLV